jgi:hypothetical protein
MGQKINLKADNDIITNVMKCTITKESLISDSIVVRTAFHHIYVKFRMLTV